MIKNKKVNNNRKKQFIWLFYLPFYVSLVSLPAQSAPPLSQEQNLNRPNVIPSKSEKICPVELEPLIKLLLRDLPGYTNRILRRSRLGDISQPSYVLMAGRPEFEPLPLGAGRTPKQESSNDETQQVFITTLERTYVAGEVVKLQQYHWLFLTKTESGWQLVMMFSRTGTYPATTSPTPPRDSSNGTTAQAIRAWLRDCNQFGHRA